MRVGNRGDVVTRVVPDFRPAAPNPSQSAARWHAKAAVGRVHEALLQVGAGHVFRKVAGDEGVAGADGVQDFDRDGCLSVSTPPLSRGTRPPRV